MTLISKDKHSVYHKVNTIGTTTKLICFSRFFKIILVTVNILQITYYYRRNFVSFCFYMPVFYVTSENMQRDEC
jgi:hypothetical protein